MEEKSSGYYSRLLCWGPMKRKVGKLVQRTRPEIHRIREHLMQWLIIFKNMLTDLPSKSIVNEDFEPKVL